MILLDDVVEEPALQPDAFDGLISDDDPRAVLRALARARLPELKQKRSTVFGQIVRCYFGGGRLSAADQLRALLRELTSANDDAARFVESCSTVEKARLRSQSSAMEVSAEREELRAQIARHQKDYAQCEAAAKRASAPAPAPTPPPDVVRRADLDAAIRLLVESSTDAIARAMAPVKTALDEHRQSLNPRLDTAITGLGNIAARVAALESWTHTAAESQQVILAQLDERGAEAAALAEQLEALQRPAVLRANERERELAEADHEIELARKRAEITAHQAAARRHRERPKSPEEEFAQRAREMLRTTKSRRRTVDKIRREIEGRLRDAAERYGDTSEQYLAQQDMYDELNAELEELK